MRTTHTRFKPAVLAVATATALLSYGGIATAQEKLQLEEVVVSARKTNENVQDVPLAISVIGTADIDRLGVYNTEDVVKRNPGMTLSHGIGPQDIRPDIRGVTSLSGRANVAILVDGVDQTSDALIGTGAGQLISLELYDLKQVEVVRGPQSALYGRNAFAGAINYITQRPSDTFEGEVGLDVGTEELIKANITLSGPISDTLRYRVKATHKEQDGQYDHPVSGNNLGGEESDALTMSLEFLPSEKLSVLGRLDWADQEIGEQPITIAPYNACRTLDASGAEVRTPGVCDLIPFEQSPSSIGKLPDADENDIRLSAEGTDGTTNELLSFNLQVDWEGDGFEIISNTAYTDHEGSSHYDLDHQETVTQLATYNPPGAPAFVQIPSLSAISFPWVDENNPFRYEFEAEIEREVIFQDLRINFSTGDNMQWIAGVEYYHEDYAQDEYSRANGAISRSNLTTTAEVTSELWLDITADPGTRPATDQTTALLELTGTLPSQAERETEAWGIYAALTWELTDSLELSLSARYQEEDIDIQYETVDDTFAAPQFESDKPGVFYPSVPTFIPGFCPSGPLSPNGSLCSVSAEGGPLNEGPRVVSDSKSFDAFNPRISLAWHYNEDHLFYGSVAKGTKPGGFNFEALLVSENVVYDQEEMITYELGWKGTWWDERILFNGTLFYNDNTDKQAGSSQPATDGNPPVPFVQNVGDTSSTGLELTNTVLLTDNLRLDLTYSYIDAEFEGFEKISSDGIGTTDLGGKSLPRTPEHSALLSLQYYLPVGEAEFYARGDVIYRDEMFADDLGWTYLPERTTVDVQLGWLTDTWEVVGYVNNLFDEDSLVGGIGFADFLGQFQTIYIGTPAIQRNGGVRLRYRF